MFEQTQYLIERYVEEISAMAKHELKQHLQEVCAGRLKGRTISVDHGMGVLYVNIPKRNGKSTLHITDNDVWFNGGSNGVGTWHLYHMQLIKDIQAVIIEYESEVLHDAQGFTKFTITFD